MYTRSIGRLGGEEEEYNVVIDSSRKWKQGTYGTVHHVIMCMQLINIRWRLIDLSFRIDCVEC